MACKTAQILSVCLGEAISRRIITVCSYVHHFPMRVYAWPQGLSVNLDGKNMAKI